MSDQTEILRRVLADLPALPSIAPPEAGDFLSRSDAERILEVSLQLPSTVEDETLCSYLEGHRKRLVETLTLIPHARREGARCLDVGSYGLMGAWLQHYLGYEEVVGIELRTEVEHRRLMNELQLGGDVVQWESLNFDISSPEWPISGEFDLVVMLEVLEHVNEDPMRVIENIHRLLAADGDFVISVPNVISYKGLKEFLSGMPPWTYWFYQPDLGHEPRHCFEYTPIVLHVLLASASFRALASRTIFAYSEPELEQPTLAVAETLGMDPEAMGETMIVLARKASGVIQHRHPDVLYSPDAYYASSWPVLSSRYSETCQELVGDGSRIKELRRRKDELESELEALRGELAPYGGDPRELLAENSRLRSDLSEALFVMDCYLRGTVSEELREINADNHPPKASLELENNELKAQVAELLFTCDCYLQQINDPQHCSQVVREALLRRALRRAKATARKIPGLRTILRPMYRQLKRTIKSHG